MSPDLLLALVGYAFAATGTPGPNNMMVLASGANYGYLRTVPHMVGIWTGLATMLVAMGAGLGQAFEVFPPLQTGLKIASTAYLLYLAWKIATAAPPDGQSAGGRPMTVVQAALFQWVNPKAWAMALTVISAYLPAPSPENIGIAILTFTGAAMVSNSVWAVLGIQGARLLTTPARLRSFNRAMAGLLVLSLWPVVVA
ncbi:MAG: LysE family translocator [Pseudomonadota bacterium]